MMFPRDVGAKLSGYDSAAWDAVQYALRTPTPRVARLFVEGDGFLPSELHFD